MVVYGHRSRPIDIGRFLRDFLTKLAGLPRAPSHDAIVDLLIDFGEVEAAVADAWNPSEDDDVAAFEPWSREAQAIAAALCASWRGATSEVSVALDECRGRAAELVETAAPTIRIRTPEGFAHYALYPEDYIARAQQLASEVGQGTIVSIGIRSIGLTLAHVVSAAVERFGARSALISVRPRGHPFERQVVMSQRLANKVRTSAAACFAVVDEGPGLSGSSFASVADALAGHGVPRDKIVLFPSWNAPSHALRSARARVVWDMHRKIHLWDRVGLQADATYDDAIDISAGRWREVVLGPQSGRWPAVHAQHERTKYLVRGQATQQVARFAGLGRYGRAKVDRARRLSERGMTSSPVSLEHGYLVQRWIAGPPVAGTVRFSSSMLERIAEYIAFVRAAFPTGEAETVSDLLDMLGTNVSEAIGTAALAAVERLGVEAEAFAEPQIAVDGRMLPHEWIAAADRLLKVDGLDHHADDFFPGCRDIAWDLAGAIVEFNMPDSVSEVLVDSYSRQSGDRTIAMRLPFYRAAYLAYRLGYAMLASETLTGTPDGGRFDVLMARYRRSLELLLGGSHRGSLR